MRQEKDTSQIKGFFLCSATSRRRRRRRKKIVHKPTFRKNENRRPSPQSGRQNINVKG